jgi:ubiquitin carboxyl-terminal hydrolase 7
MSNSLVLDLNVDGIKNLYYSFRDYVQTDILDGENKYWTPNNGPQAAIKGVIFQRFPPLLYIRLQRFRYDIQENAMVKVR